MQLKRNYVQFTSEEPCSYKWKLHADCPEYARFIKSIIYGDEKKYYTEEQANKVILDASNALDFELENAFELEVYLKRYEKKMIKRFKKINKFSRFNIN